MTQPLGPYSTYDQTPPQQPSNVTFNDCQKQNDPNPNAPPLNPVTDPNAPEYNQLCSLAIAYGVMMPTARICLNGGSITSVVSTVQAVNGQLAAFSVTGPSGARVIEWTTSQMLPAVRSAPTASLNFVLGAHTYAVSALYVTGPNGRQAIEVTSVLDGVVQDVGPIVVAFH